jgi:integrase
VGVSALGRARLRRLPAQSRPGARGAAAGPASGSIAPRDPVPVHGRGDRGADRRRRRAAVSAAGRDLPDADRAARRDRVGEAIRLDRGDLDLTHELLVVRDSKFGKTRELPLHPSTIRALRDYLHLRDRLQPSSQTPALLVSPAGTRLIYCNVHATFRQLRDIAGLQPRSGRCRPRIHDLRHSFAIRTLLDAHHDEDDVQQRLSLLSTYLGHVNPGATYWYLSAAPELLALAGNRLERHFGARS